MLALTACPPATRSGDVNPQNQCVGEGGRFVSAVQLQILVLEGRVFYRCHGKSLGKELLWQGVGWKAPAGNRSLGEEVAGAASCEGSGRAGLILGLMSSI